MSVDPFREDGVNPATVFEILRNVLGQDWAYRPKAPRTVPRQALVMAWELISQLFHPAWEPFEPAEAPAAARAQLRDLGMTEDDWIFINNYYQVNVRLYPPTDDPALPPMMHLSIRTLGKYPVYDWRHLQRIKNEIPGLCNPAWDGRTLDFVERFPPEDMLVDTANQFHLWGIVDPAFRWPIGWNTRLVAEDSGMNAVQRPFDDDNRPEGLVDLSTPEKVRELAATYPKENNDGRTT